MLFKSLPASVTCALLAVVTCFAAVVALPFWSTETLT